MLLKRAFTLSVYLLVAIGVVSLSVAEGNPLLIALTAILTALAYYKTEVLEEPFGRLATNLLMAAALLFTPADYLFLTGDVPLTVTHFLLALQLLKLFGEKKARDYNQIIAISLMHLGSAAVLTIGFAFGIAFVTFMTVGTWTLLLFLLVREIERAAPNELKTVRVGRKAAVALGGVTALTLAITVVLFFVFPRFSAVLFQIPRREPPRVTGFSEEIGLTDLSAIQENQENVMRVIVEKKSRTFPTMPRWRGLAFDRYREGKWLRPSLDVAHIGPVEIAGGEKRWFLPRARVVRDEAAMDEYSITLSATGNQVLFTLADPSEVVFLSASAPSSVVTDAAGSVITASLPATDVRYRVRSGGVQRRPGERRSRPGMIEDVDYLDLPTDRVLVDALTKLAREVVDKDGAESIQDRAASLERHLAAGVYSYTLDLKPAPRGRDPLLHFLFDTKSGHCELSASSFVLLARTLGIPSRLVTGFLSGAWNPLGDYYQVRQSDAHAWAECFIDGGWVELDPTPQRTDIAGGQRELSAAAQVFDYMALRWQNYVIGYTMANQIAFAEEVRRNAQSVRERIEAWARHLTDRLTGIDPRRATRLLTWGGLVGAILIAIAVGAQLRWRRRRPAQKTGPPPIAFYERFVKLLARHGHTRAPSETPREFAARLAELDGVTLDKSRDVMEAFYEMRFGERALPAPRQQEVDAAIDAIETWLATPPASRAKAR